MKAARRLLHDDVMMTLLASRSLRNKKESCSHTFLAIIPLAGAHAA
jgi:hypothetical protein